MRASTTPPRRPAGLTTCGGKGSSRPPGAGGPGCGRSRAPGGAAPIVETVAAVLQMNASTLHPSINIEALDPEVDLDVCPKGPVDCEVRYMMKNSFGFGGINCVSVLKRFEA